MTLENLIPVGWDTETFPIGPGAVAPKIVCLSMAFRDPDTGDIVKKLIANGDPDFKEQIHWLITQPNFLLISHGAAFDWTVIAAAFPEFIELICAAFERSGSTCNIVREKLLNISSHGRIKYMEMEGVDSDDEQDKSNNVPLEYNLAALVNQYFGVDISEDKEGSDSVRNQYHQMDGKRADEYPAQFRDYSLMDAEWHLRCWEAQENKRRGESGPWSTRTEYFNSGVDFALRMQTCHGFKIDENERDRKKAELAEQLSPRYVSMLLEAGILQPAEPPRPNKNNPKKMTAGKPEKRNMKVLRQAILKVAQDNKITPILTEGKEVATSEAQLMVLESFSPLIKQYRYRQNLADLVSKGLKRVDHPVVHIQYNVIVETGRTSSSMSDLFPSVQGQNIDERIRSIYTARDGHVLCSGDYAAMELVTLSNKCLELFGESKLADLINSGVNPHDYLGSFIAYKCNAAFKEAIDTAGIRDEMELYRAFKALESSEDPKANAVFAKYRKLAKPTNLGYPGGLGYERFLAFAKKDYGVDLIEELGSIQAAEEFAKMLKAIWFEAYPEMREYFKWITSSCVDPLNTEKFAYFSPFGMYRAGTDYCSAANGAGMQTPTGEGAKLGVWEVFRACYDRTMESCLYGCRQVLFLHDQQILEIPEDRYMHERAFEMSRIMVQSMEQVATKVRVRVDPILMRSWHKKAKPVFDKAGRLQVWIPT